MPARGCCVGGGTGGAPGSTPSSTGLLGPWLPASAPPRSFPRPEESGGGAPPSSNGVSSASAARRRSCDRVNTPPPETSVAVLFPVVAFFGGMTSEGHDADADAHERNSRAPYLERQMSWCRNQDTGGSCCLPKPTGEQRRATRRAGRLPGLLVGPGPSGNGPQCSGTHPDGRKGMPPDLYLVRKVLDCFD